MTGDITVLGSPSLPATADDLDYYGVVLANLLKNRQAILEEKRSCIDRGAPCEDRRDDCCANCKFNKKIYFLFPLGLKHFSSNHKHH